MDKEANPNQFPLSEEYVIESNSNVDEPMLFNQTAFMLPSQPTTMLLNQSTN